MPKTKSDKYQVGLEYIEGLSEDHQCKSFIVVLLVVNAYACTKTWLIH